MGERVGCDEQIERLHRHATASEHVAEIAGFLPEPRWLLQEVTALEQRQHLPAFDGRAEAAPELCDDWPAKGDVI